MRFVRFWFLVWAAHTFTIGNLVNHPGTKNPAGLTGEQGSRKSVIEGQIVNYLLASPVPVRSSPAALGHVSVPWSPNPKPGFPMRGDIPAQCNHAAACKCIGYVLGEVMGAEGNWFILRARADVKCIMTLPFGNVPFWTLLLFAFI